MVDKRQVIAKNIANMLYDGEFVNLGVGIPTMVGKYIPKNVTVFLHGENGCLGQDQLILGTQEKLNEWEKTHKGEESDWTEGHKDLCNASCEFITLLPGGCCFDSSIAFAMARGGHLDATVLGGLQVDMQGNLANWNVPGKRITGMGGAMDLVSGAKKVIVAMEHCTKDGKPKILSKCTMPLTAIKCVNIIVTELCIIECIDNQLVVKAIIPGVSKEELQKKTEAKLCFSDELGVMAIPDS